MARRSLLGGLAGLAGLAACSRVPTPTGGVAVPPTQPGTPSPTSLPYGPDPAQYGVLHLPPGGQQVPVVVVVHGGYWRAAYGLELGTPLAVDLTNRGIAAWNVEYRRVGAGGGWPMTFTDVAAALDLLPGPVQDAAKGRLDLDRVVFLGHSAGGQLVGWAASRERLDTGRPGADPKVRPVGTVSQAGVLDLVAGATQGLGGGAVTDLLGGPPEQVADRYALASPAALVPAPAPVVCVHGDADTVVPLDQSQRYVAAAVAARGDARLRVVPGADHFAIIDPGLPAWAAVREEVEGLL
ncbi:prolyl oligopeptidase family protein [Actinomycetospora succinea]|uniref:Prolyl oligopeptidase family protein n=1 Tax=Actinomycetospora succinea TaxID=663603 RepID=A0A4R6V245_9PSEU|nr:prolyl oligopeptidase family serine peptidase [Actinomycetospora succinea]TDQ53983.1 prolyl oligopeptidase family protein [Actinomycetospora succinea]